MASDLGWAWNPANAPPAQRNETARPSKVQRKRKNWRKQKRRDRLLYAPGEVFYRSKAWMALRRKVLERYGYKCMRCGEVDAVIQVDHIKPRSKHPRLSLAFSNLQVLCRLCNEWKSNLHDTDYRDEAVSREIDLRMALEARRYL